jgi:Fe2+ or Zn2+ uptake regulation protein
MTKQEVLDILFQGNRFMTPDAICRQLRGFHHRSSVYSYLFRLHKQGLLLRRTFHGRIAYQISQRGIERLIFFKSVADRKRVRLP